MKNTLTFDKIMDNIRDTLAGADGEYIAEVHNKICSDKIKYVGESNIGDYIFEENKQNT